MPFPQVWDQITKTVFSKYFFLFSTLSFRMSNNMCIWRHKLCNSKTGVGPTFTWSNEPWYIEEFYTILSKVCIALEVSLIYVDFDWNYLFYGNFAQVFWNNNSRTNPIFSSHIVWKYNNKK